MAKEPTSDIKSVRAINNRLDLTNGSVGVQAIDDDIKMGVRSLDVLHDNPVAEFPVSWHSRLDGEGEFKADFLMANLRDFYFATPRLEYRSKGESYENHPDLDNMANRWKIPETVVRRWYMEQGWEIERQEWWARMGHKMLELEPEKLKAKRLRLLHAQHELWADMIEWVNAVRQNGGEWIITVKGEKIWKEYGPNEVLKFLRSFEIIQNQQRVTLGLKATGSADALCDRDSEEEKRLGCGANITINLIPPNPDREIGMMPAAGDLPALPDGDAIEGEVVS